MLLYIHRSVFMERDLLLYLRDCLLNDSLLLGVNGYLQVGLLLCGGYRVDTSFSVVEDMCIDNYVCFSLELLCGYVRSIDI